jgi:hypothetical protein
MQRGQESRSSVIDVVRPVRGGDAVRANVNAVIEVKGYRIEDWRIPPQRNAGRSVVTM